MDVGLLPRLDKIFLRNLNITYSSVCIVRAMKEHEEVRVMTSSFSDEGRAAVLDRSAEISRSEIARYRNPSNASYSSLSSSFVSPFQKLAP